MFDGLKDRLSDFRRDAEEEIDEATAEVEENEPADEPEPAVEADPSTEPEETVPTATEPDADSGPALTDPDAATDDSPSTAESDAEADAAPVASDMSDTETTETETAVEPEAAEPAGEETVADESDERAAGDAEADSKDEEATRTRLRRPSPAEETEDGGEEDGEKLGFGTRAKLFATGQSLIEAAELEGPLFELEMALLESDVEMSVTEAILDRLREELTGATRAQVKGTGLVVEEALAEALREVISVGQFDFEERVAEAEKPVTIVFTGVNGVGKTTTIAKLARYFEERGLSTVLANGDTYRAGANQQLGEHAENLDKEYIAHEQGSDPAAVLYDAVEYAEAHDIDVVLGDTAGRLHTSNDLMAQLEKIDRVVDPDMTLFVDEAVAGQDATNRAREFDDAATIDGAILAKADADSQGGAAISIAHVTGKPILFLGTGQGYDDIERFDPDALVDRLLGADEE
ncbi:signal recognition particle-docking protein FtsY [Halococcus sediminicola]|uniref:signal recognition particle-docking protein FtsY n=1 Tax=Halococcus sediminicola TaxID=1264579 RepID=UPI0006788CC3|nr:signal recognition particle-docking protein FtsY [Halococcus sediminicola]